MFCFRLTAYAVTFVLWIMAPASAAQVEACFVPGQDCTAVVVREIDGARHEVLVQAYGFTSIPIADALISAKDRGVTIRAIFDKSDRPKEG